MFSATSAGLGIVQLRARRIVRSPVRRAASAQLRQAREQGVDQKSAAEAPSPFRSGESSARFVHARRIGRPDQPRRGRSATAACAPVGHRSMGCAVPPGTRPPSLRRLRQYQRRCVVSPCANFRAHRLRRRAPPAGTRTFPRRRSCSRSRRHRAGPWRGSARHRAGGDVLFSDFAPAPSALAWPDLLRRLVVRTAETARHPPYTEDVPSAIGLSGSEVVSGRMTMSASSPLAPCTVITRTSLRPRSMSRLISAPPRSTQCEEALQRRRVGALHRPAPATGTRRSHRPLPGPAAPAVCSRIPGRQRMGVEFERRASRRAPASRDRKACAAQARSRRAPRQFASTARPCARGRVRTVFLAEPHKRRAQQRRQIEIVFRQQRQSGPARSDPSPRSVRSARCGRRRPPARRVLQLADDLRCRTARAAAAGS